MVGSRGTFCCLQVSSVVPVVKSEQVQFGFVAGFCGNLLIGHN